jgi:hypothetical protein
MASPEKDICIIIQTTVYDVSEVRKLVDIINCVTTNRKKMVRYTSILL